MSITDELREYATNDSLHYCSDYLAIADRIDAEHEKAEQDLIDANNQMEQLCECSIGLPVDADGVPIRVGDVMEWPYGNGEFIVEGIGGNTLFYIDKDSNECEWTAAGDKRHHHEPTVEDVLREFAEKIIDSQIPSMHPTYEEAIAEYAAKLRLAGEDE